MEKLLVAIALCAPALCGTAAVERADFATGEGTNGWTISAGEYVSPTYANSVKNVRLDYSGESTGGASITVHATPSQGGETQIATLNGASNAATIEFPAALDFRSFRIAVSGGMDLSSFAASINASHDAFPVSSLSGNAYTQNFDALAAVTATAGDKEWLNGMTLPYWQAWSGVDAAGKFTYSKGGNITVSGFYALASNRTDSVRAFGACAKRGTAMTWGIAFTNDTDWTVSLSSVVYSAQQWGFANTTNNDLVFSCLVTNSLDWIANIHDGWNDCSVTTAQCLKDVQHDTPVATAVSFVPAGQIRVPAGWVLLMKWSVRPPASGYSSLMAIDDLRVTFEEVPRPLMIRLAGSGNLSGDNL